MHGWSWLLVIVIAAWVVVGRFLLVRYQRRSPTARAGRKVRDFSPWVGLYRQHRLDKGKKDNWFLRPFYGPATDADMKSPDTEK